MENKNSAIRVNMQATSSMEPSPSRCLVSSGNEMLQYLVGGTRPYLRATSGKTSWTRSHFEPLFDIEDRDCDQECLEVEFPLVFPSVVFPDAFHTCW